MYDICEEIHCMWCHYFKVVIKPWATQENLDTGGGCGGVGGEGLKIWMDDKWSGTSDKLRVPMSPGCDVMETGGMWGGGSCWFDTEMTAYSSRERSTWKFDGNDMIGSKRLWQDVIGFCERVTTLNQLSELKVRQRKWEREFTAWRHSSWLNLQCLCSVLFSYCMCGSFMWLSFL